jgi:multicomponent Na+:H+ antiporter subunit D
MNLAVLPILMPLLTALAVIVWGRPSRGRRWFIAASGAAQLALALVILFQNWEGHALVLGVGYWTYRVGIMLVVDLLAAIMISLSTLVALAAILYTFVECDLKVEHPLRLPLLELLLAGINLSFCTGDLFNLFVAFEVMLIASYALLTLEADNWGVKQAYPYLALNLVGGTLFLCAAGLAYSLFGTLNFADIGVRVEQMSGDGRVLALALLLIIVFGTKAGLFPLFYWLPNSYPTLPIPLAALYAAMLTKVGVYVLLRLFGTVLPHDLGLAHQLLMVLAGLTMVLAILGAVARNFIRGILAFNLLSHIGFMVLAIGFFTPRSLAAAIYYMIHHIVVMASLFLLTGAVISLNRTDDLSRMGNLWKQAPWVGVLFLLQAMSLSGLPPLSGFWGKYLIVETGLQHQAYLLVAAVIVASLLTLISMLKIWNGAFWRAAPAVTVHLSGSKWARLAWIAGALTMVSLGIGLGAEGFMRLSLEASRRLLNKGAYAELVFQVLGKGGN